MIPTHSAAIGSYIVCPIYLITSKNLKFSWCNGIQIDRDTRQIFSPDLSELLERIKLAQIRYSRRANEKGLKEMQLFELILTNCNVRSLFEIKWMHKVEHTTKLFNYSLIISCLIPAIISHLHNLNNASSVQ